MIPHFPFVGSRLLPDDNAEVGVVFSLGKLVSCPDIDAGRGSSASRVRSHGLLAGIKHREVTSNRTV
jgi:hypothetical protein